MIKTMTCLALAGALAFNGMAGKGLQRSFIDENDDGVCDRYESCEGYRCHGDGECVFECDGNHYRRGCGK